MELISQDYCFKEFTREQSQFVVDCYDMYPAGEVTQVKYVFPLKTGFIYLNFRSPEDTAAWLKLKYGDSLVIRPEPKPETTSMFDIWKQKSRNTVDKWDYYYDLESKWDIKDYQQIMSNNKKLADKRENDKIKQLYEDSIREFMKLNDKNKF